MTKMRRRLVSHVPRNREERDQDSNNNPNVEAHREEPLASLASSVGVRCVSPLRRDSAAQPNYETGVLLELIVGFPTLLPNSSSKPSFSAANCDWCIY
jgi:hypothetical protein